MGEPAAQLAISYDLPCPRCGYNLRGLQPEGRCPECAQKIEGALGEKLFRFANVRWLKILLCGIAAEICCIILLPVALILASMSLGPYSQILIALDGLFFATACCLLTVPDPAASAHSARWLLRVLGLLSLLGMMGLAGFWFQRLAWFIAFFSLGLILMALLMKIHLLHKLGSQYSPPLQTQILSLLGMVFWFIALSAFLCVIMIVDINVTGFGVASWALPLYVILIMISLVTYLAALCQLFYSICQELDIAKSADQSDLSKSA